MHAFQAARAQVCNARKHAKGRAMARRLQAGTSRGSRNSRAQCAHETRQRVQRAAHIKRTSKPTQAARGKKQRQKPRKKQQRESKTEATKETRARECTHGHRAATRRAKLCSVRSATARSSGAALHRYNGDDEARGAVRAPSECKGNEQPCRLRTQASGSASSSIQRRQRASRTAENGPQQSTRSTRQENPNRVPAQGDDARALDAEHVQIGAFGCCRLRGRN
jgi:hypothetical protein